MALERIKMIRKIKNYKHTYLIGGGTEEDVTIDEVADLTKTEVYETAGAGSSYQTCWLKDSTTVGTQGSIGQVITFTVKEYY